MKAIRERSGIGPRATPDGTRANYRRGVHSIINALAEVEVATIAANIAAQPLAAMTLVQLLRHNEEATPEQGLLATRVVHFG